MAQHDRLHWRRIPVGIQKKAADQWLSPGAAKELRSDEGGLNRNENVSRPNLSVRDLKRPCWRLNVSGVVARERDTDCQENAEVPLSHMRLVVGAC
jgi:hypothetical protein